MKIFLSYSYTDAQELASALGRALAKAGHDVFDPASAVNSGDISTRILAALRESEAMIALMTNATPNVHFEAGVASGAQVPVLVAASSSDHLAFALSSMPYVQLTGDTVADVDEILRRVAETWPGHDAAGGAVPQPAEPPTADAAADLEALERLTPQEFERLVAELLRNRGFPVQARSPREDRGFDILIDGEPPTVVEVKRYSRGGLVSVGAVRQLLAAMAAAGAGRSILVSSSGFTKSAMAAAVEWPVDLMTLEDLLRLPEVDAGA